MSKINWSEKFNSLTPEIREIISCSETKLRIQHLNFEKTRLKKRYNQSLSEINDHIKNCEDWLNRFENKFPQKTRLTIK